MDKHITSRIPVIDMQGFRHSQTAGADQLIFNEIRGGNHIATAHRHDFFMIILFVKGSGVHIIDSVQYNITDRQVHVLFPGQVHRWNIEPGTEGYQLMVARPLLEQFAPYFRFSFTNYQNHPVIVLSEYSFQGLFYGFRAIKAELNNQSPLLQLITAYAGVIAAIVSKEAEHSFQEFKVYQSHPILAGFNMLIDEFFREKKTVAFYAGKLHLTANYLNILCKKHLKVSATQLINQRIVLEAKRLLQCTSLSVKEIAAELGYNDHAHFSNFFKARTAVPPSEFRKK